MKILAPIFSLNNKILLALLLVVSFLAQSESPQDYEKALTSFNKEDFKASYIHLKNALQSSPDHLPSKLLMARILLIDGYVDDAITEFLDVMQAGVDKNLIIIPLANAYLIKQAYQKVIELTLPATAPEASKLELLLLKANAHTHLKEHQLAEKLYTDGTNLYGKDIRLINGLSQVWLSNKNYAKAKFFNEQALTIEPNNPQSLLFSGLIYQAEKQYSQAQAQLLRAYQLSPQDPPIMRALANSYVQTGDIEAANELIAKIDELNPNDLQVMLLKARLLALDNQNVEAGKLLTELSNKLSLATEEDKQRLSWISLVTGITAHVTGNYRVSVNEISRYLQNEDATLELVTLLVEGNLKLGDSKEAIKILEQYPKLTIESVQTSSLLCELYMAANKMFKCYNLVQELKSKHSENDALTLLEAKMLAQRQQYDNALKLLDSKLKHSKLVSVLVFRATILAKLERFNDALIDVKQALEKSPDNIDLINLNIDLLIRTQAIEEAENYLKYVIELDPKNIASNINFARLLFSQGKPDEALDKIKSVLRTQPTNTTALLLAGQILSKQRKYEQAIEQLIAAKTVDSNNPAPRELLVNIYKMQNRFDYANGELDQLLKLRILEPEYLLEKTKLYLQQNKLPDAITQMNLLLGKWSTEPLKLVELSHYQLLAGDVAGAKNSLLQAQNVDNSLLIPKLEYTNLLINEGSVTDAQAKLVELKKSYPNNASVVLLDGHIYKAQGKTEQAYNAYKKAAQMSSGFDAALIELYQLASSGIQVEDVKNILTRQISARPQVHFIRHLLADLYFVNRNYAQAQKLYEGLLAIENLPNKAKIYNNLANISSSTDIAKAISYATQAIALDANSAAILDTYGWLLTQNNEPQRGLDVLRQAFTLQSNEPSIRYHIAVTLHKLGRIQEAKSELQQLLATEQKFPEQQQAAKLLSEI